ncbi:phosphotransferase [Micromonospora sp. L31]|uniref:phosphotransferase n=1 Tax=Micromonospora sp. L31 TaxID=3452213 RepID=UPI003F892BBF
MTVRLPSAPGYAAQVAKEQCRLPVLAPHLPLPVPIPLAQGEPAEGYPFAWSVYRWIEGGTGPGGADRRPDRVRHQARRLPRGPAPDRRHVRSGRRGAQRLARRTTSDVRRADPGRDRRTG